MESEETQDCSEANSHHSIKGELNKTIPVIPQEANNKDFNVPPLMKRKKIHMNDAQCLSHSMTPQGAMPLTNPRPQGLSKARHWDANRGLYPRHSTSRRHWSPDKGSSVHGQGNSSLTGSPMKQGRINSFFPTSPRKTPASNVIGSSDNSESNYKACSDKGKSLSMNLRSPGKCTEPVSHTFPTNEKAHFFLQENHFKEPRGSRESTPKKLVMSEPKCTGNSLHASGSSPVPFMKDQKSPNPLKTSVKALFPLRDTDRHSTDLLKAFEEDDSVTTEMFDDAMGTPDQSKQISRDKPGCSYSIEKDFDEVLQSSQGLIKCEAKHPVTTDFEKALEEEELTAEEFDDILQSSQSPVKSGPLKSSPKKNTFGLLGDNDDDDEEDDEDYFDRLPDEVLENILGQLPILDLCITAASVCKRWHRIISREQFVPWKKRYHQMKKVQDQAFIQEIENFVADGDEIEKRACLVQLIGFMEKLRVTDRHVTVYLKDHPRYNEAVQVMKERTAQVFDNQHPHPWSTIATIIILSQSAAEVCGILDLLLIRKEPIARMDVSECLYFIASALFLFQKKFKINRGLHYRVFHALHILESSDVGNDEEMSDTARRSDRGQQSLLRYGLRQGINLTPEQLRIINHNLLPTDTIKIIAFAGTGKTTTLVKFAQLRPNMSFLYIAFNKTVQIQAVEKFPKNVECRTLHSLAYRAVGFKYRNKMGSSLKPYFIQPLLPKHKEITIRGKKMHHMTLAKYVCTTINHFLASDNEFITTAHVPTMDTTMVPRRPLDHGVRMDIGEAAQTVFDALIDVKNTETRITHDVYMKLYELQRPQLEGYDCLLIDEAQDLTLAQQSILLRQRCAKILVGDPHQQIYSFRGATNAMARVEATRLYHLTQSFRFGPEIAYVASCLLEALKQQTKSTIIGAGPQGRVDGEQVGQLATICRSNSKLFTEAVNMVRRDNNIKIQFSGGIEGYGFDKILDLYYLSLPKEQRGSYRIKDKFIARFHSMKTVWDYAVSVDDMDLQSRITLVKQYPSQIPTLVDKIKRASVKSNAAYLLTTAHKAKGLEYDTVKLTDDFLTDDPQLMTQGVQTMEDEKNILYVAVTRAKKSLLLNNALMQFLKKVGEKFEYPVLAKKLKEEKGPERCQECGVVQNDDKQVLLLERKALKLTHSIRPVSIKGGIVCPKCVESPGFEELYGKPPPTEEEQRAMEDADRARQQPGVFVVRAVVQQP